MVLHVMTGYELRFSIELPLPWKDQLSNLNIDKSFQYSDNHIFPVGPRSNKCSFPGDV